MRRPYDVRTLVRMPVSDRPGPPGWFDDRRLPWTWAERQIERARNYWVATASAAGQVHTRPVWGVWIDGSLYLSVGGARMAANLRSAQALSHSERANVTVHLESGDRVVILEGSAQLVPTPAPREFYETYNAKYEWDYTPEFPGDIVAFRPARAYGWISDVDDRGESFQNSATRWTF